MIVGQNAALFVSCAMNIVFPVEQLSRRLFDFGREPSEAMIKHGGDAWRAEGEETKKEGY